jgi:sugar phosphate isomerase/epimerase
MSRAARALPSRSVSTIPLSCGDHSFGLLPLEHAIRLIGMLELDAVDLVAQGGGDAHVRPEDVRRDVGGSATKLHAQLDTAGLVAADVFVIPWSDFETLAPNHPDAAVRAAWRDLLDDMVELAARVGAPGVTTVPGVDWPADADALARAAEQLSWAAERAARAGLRFSFEPHVGSICTTPEAVLELLALTPGVELTLDYSHFVAHGIDPAGVHPLLVHARHVHARAARPGRLQCSLPQSTIDYGEVVGLLRAGGYAGYVTIEYLWADWQHMNECDTLRETLVLRDRLRSYMS